MSNNSDRVTTLEKVGYGLGDLSIALYLNFLSFFLLYFFVDVGGLAPAAVGTMMLLTKMLDAVTDPAMGLIADRTRSRWGRYRGYLLWGAVPFGLSGAAIFAAPGLDGSGLLVWGYVTYGLSLIAFTVVSVPYAALLGAISPRARERASTAAYRMIFSALGGITVGVLGTTLIRELGKGDESRGIMLTMLGISAVAVVCMLVAFASTRERVPPARLNGNIAGDLAALVRSTSWIAIAVATFLVPVAIASRASSALFFYKYVVKDDGTPVFLFLDRVALFFTALAIGQVTGIVAANLLSRRIEKRTLLLFAGALKAGSLLWFYYMPLDALWWQTIAQLGIGLGFGIMMILAYSMFTDVAEYLEWKSGRQMTALVISASIFALKAGVAFGAALPGILLAMTGFVAGQEQSANSVFGINLAFSIVPVLLLIPAMIAILSYRVDHRTLERAEAELAARRAALG